MNYNWRTIGESTAVITVVLSLVFVGYEMRMNRAIAINDSFGQRSEMTTGVNSLIIENMDVWRKGCLGESLSENEEATFIRLIATK